MKRTYFLAPKFGWRPWEIGPGDMLELGFYYWLEDLLLFHWEATGRDLWNHEHKLEVEKKGYFPSGNPGDEVEIARCDLQNRMRMAGLIAMPVKPRSGHQSTVFSRII